MSDETFCPDLSRQELSNSKYQDDDLGIKSMCGDDDSQNEIAGHSDSEEVPLHVNRNRETGLNWSDEPVDQKHAKRPRKQEPRVWKKKASCFYCQQQHMLVDCPTAPICNKCGRKGHTETACRKQNFSNSSSSVDLSEQTLPEFEKEKPRIDVKAKLARNVKKQKRVQGLILKRFCGLPVSKLLKNTSPPFVSEDKISLVDTLPEMDCVPDRVPLLDAQEEDQPDDYPPIPQLCWKWPTTMIIHESIPNLFKSMANVFINTSAFAITKMIMRNYGIPLLPRITGTAGLVYLILNLILVVLHRRDKTVHHSSINEGILNTLLKFLPDLFLPRLLLGTSLLLLKFATTHLPRTFWMYSGQCKFITKVMTLSQDDGSDPKITSALQQLQLTRRSDAEELMDLKHEDPLPMVAKMEFCSYPMDGTPDDCTPIPAYLMKLHKLRNPDPFLVSAEQVVQMTSPNVIDLVTNLREIRERINNTVRSAGSVASDKFCTLLQSFPIADAAFPALYAAADRNWRRQGIDSLNFYIQNTSAVSATATEPGRFLLYNQL